MLRLIAVILYVVGVYIVFAWRRSYLSPRSYRQIQRGHAVIFAIHRLRRQRKAMRIVVIEGIVASRVPTLCALFLARCNA